MTTKEIVGAYPLQVGNQAAWALHDGFLWGEPVQQYAIGVSDAEIATLFEPHFLNPQRIQLGMNPILFRWGTELVLADTGMGSVVGDPIGLLGKRLSALHIQPDEVCGAAHSPAYRSRRRVIGQSEQEITLPAGPYFHLRGGD